MLLKSLTVLVAFVLLAFLAGGCAGIFSTPSTQQVLAKIAIQQATLRAVQKNPARAAAVVSIVDRALEIVESGDDAVITAAELRSALDMVLPKDLSPADNLLAGNLVELIVAEVNARVPADQINLPVAEVSAVLGWVKEAAVLVVPPAP
jgi:uncharacterized lipoprotein YajG